jgi:aldehyde dehydrogenase (NAD+)
VFERHGLTGIFNLVIGDVPTVGERMLRDPRISLVSATGSCAMGRRVAEVVGARLGRTLLELGGNNGVIVMDDANLQMVVRAVLFGAVGTAGQRCTSIRRLFIQKRILQDLTGRLVAAYGQVRTGPPLEPETLMGPLINKIAVDRMMEGLRIIREQGGEVIYGGKHLGGCYVEPALVRAHPQMPIIKTEIFAPILYLIEFEDLAQAIAWHNDVPQGLSSAMFTTNVISAETFLSHAGSDCGIANINIGTSGAEIGGAFGGEKETGGGREAGSDAWKAYMRRATNTINFGRTLPLAQGVAFEVG